MEVFEGDGGDARRGVDVTEGENVRVWVLRATSEARHGGNRVYGLEVCDSAWVLPFLTLQASTPPTLMTKRLLFTAPSPPLEAPSASRVDEKVREKRGRSGGGAHLRSSPLLDILISPPLRPWESRSSMLSNPPEMNTHCDERSE